MSYVIDVTGLTKHFGKLCAVNHLDLQVKRGEIYGFLGPNGSGKTTAIRMLCGLLKPDAGSGSCLGYDILTQSAQIKCFVGYMTQRFSLYEDLTIRENLNFIGHLYSMKNRQQAVKQSLVRLRLEERQNQLAGSLSGGWKQRLALAACMLHEPQLLLLDEPTAGVDPKARRDFWDEVHRLAASGISVLVSTHYMDEAERCHRLAYIAHGKLMTTGTSKEIIAQSGLTTWAVSGGDLVSLSEKLKTLADIEQIVPFGNTLHISDINEQKLQANLLPFQASPDYQWEKIKPSLEDTFIHLMNKAKPG